jgi:hypothetical protein
MVHSRFVAEATTDWYPKNSVPQSLFCTTFLSPRQFVFWAGMLAWQNPLYFAALCEISCLP